MVNTTVTQGATTRDRRGGATIVRCITMGMMLRPRGMRLRRRWGMRRRGGTKGLSGGSHMRRALGRGISHAEII
jgi:hypothetical protein